MKLGIFTVCLPEYTPEEAMRLASEIGFDGLEWRVKEDTGDRANPSFWSGNRTSLSAAEIRQRAPELLETAEKYGLEIPSLGAYITCLAPDAVEEAFAAARALHARNVRVNTASFQGTDSYAERFEASRKGYREVEKLARQYGVRALIETHPGLVTPTAVSARAILEGLSPEYTGIAWDPGNQVHEGRERVCMALSVMGEYLAEVHVKNAALFPAYNRNGTLEWRGEACQLQMGIVNWPAVIDALKKEHDDLYLMLEDFSSTGDRKAQTESNFRYLKSLL